MSVQGVSAQGTGYLPRWSAQEGVSAQGVFARGVSVSAQEVSAQGGV